jgi:ribose transport system permease protein
MSDIFPEKLKNVQNLVPKKRKYFFNTQPFYLFVIILVIGVVISIINPNFLTRSNLTNIFVQDAVIGIMTLASAVILISGGIDLSIGSMMSLTCCVMAKLITMGINSVLAIFIGVLVAMSCGLVNGVILSRTKCPPFIITLGTGGIFVGAALILAQGKIINIPVSVKLFRSWKIGFIPLSVIIFLVACVVVYFILSRFRIGRRLYVIGGNEEAAFFSGININLYKLLVYGFGGLVIGIASIVLLERLGSANAGMGKGYELQSIAAAVIGGVSLSGGKGSIVGAFFGVLLLGVISNALNIVGVSPFFQELALGVIIVFAVILSSFGDKK